MASRCIPGPNDGIATMVIVSKYRLECKEDFFVVSENSEEKAICSLCGGTLRRRDTRRRVYKEAGGKKSWFLINRLKCTNKECGRLHNELPDCIVPYKHYGSEIIEDVLDEVVGPDDLETEDYPCEGTMKHWKWWFIHNRENIEGQMKSKRNHLLDLGDGFLKSKESLLDEIRKRISPGWLSAVVYYIYNSGCRIEPNPEAKDMHLLLCADKVESV